jgi:prenylcysteine oxidase/farnesylcysteine lyase
MNHKFPEYVRISLREHLQDVKLHNDTIEQLIESIALVNYGQNVDQLHAFVGSVSTSGADFGGELWAVEGGNQQIPQKMLVSCNAHVILNTEIVKIVRQKSSFQVIDMKGNEKLYDSVVIAHPLPLSTLKFSNFDVSTSTNIEKEMNRGNYHQTVATFIAGKRSGNLSLPEIDEVMICDPSYPYQSIAKQTPVEKYDLKTCETCAIDVFKIFSREILTQDQLSFLFDDVSYKLVIPWLAYPEYKKMESTPFFVLSPGLFYVNAIEWAASAMEMSLVGGRNVALLLQDFLKDTVKQRK